MIFFFSDVLIYHCLLIFKICRFEECTRKNGFSICYSYEETSLRMTFEIFSLDSFC